EAQEEAERATTVRTERRRVPRAALEALLASGTILSNRLDDWPLDLAPLDRHLEHLERVLDGLGWGPDSPEARHLGSLLDDLREAPPVRVDREELVLTIRRLATELGREPLGGRGGGVQVMGVVEARGLTFEHLFVLGLNRGVFPRTVREDPVLSDVLRKRLEGGGHGLLPDLPIKRRGYQEERYLFAQLLSSAPHVTLSWLELDDDDRPMAPSPLIERLRWSHASEAAGWRRPPVTGRRAILDRHGDRTTLTRRFSRLPPREHLVLAALEGERDELPGLLDAALSRADRERSDAGEGSPAIEWGRVGTARVAVLDELDPRTRQAAESCLTPYLGFVGPVISDADPRANPELYVTTVERMATCPWQTFLERLLRVEAVPDPLEALPQIDPLMVGIVVHGVLERIVSSTLERSGGALEELLARAPTAVDWPDEGTLDRILAEQAEATVRATGVALRGFSRALTAVARPYLDVARRIEWGRRPTPTLGAEVEGSLPVASPSGVARRIAFRADRVDRDEEAILLVDYKTGASPFGQQSAKKRYQRYLAELASGSRLQPAVYAAAVGDSVGHGRFTFLRPDLDTPEEARWITASSQDSTVRQRLDHVVTTVLAAWEGGYFFPRLELPEGVGKAPPACQWCRVAEACLRQDSGSRRRLRLGMERLRSRPSEIDPASRAALLEQWWLAAPEQRPDDLSSVEG
ncbi:MAG: PD-(D/E)XK nuclease family protein, partial [Thermoanaerobaculia bacterium]|nr:PD-(D/E)XK nuclease family protein [Thermoanaerobaculia bacterium]